MRRHLKRQAKLARYDRLLFIGDSLLAAKYNRIKYDTQYISRPDARWTVKFTGVLSGADMQTIAKDDGAERKTHVMADCRGTFSVAAAYRGLGLSLSVNPAKLAGRTKTMNSTSIHTATATDSTWCISHRRPSTATTP